MFIFFTRHQTSCFVKFNEMKMIHPNDKHILEMFFSVCQVRLFCTVTSVFPKSWIWPWLSIL